MSVKLDRDLMKLAEKLLLRGFNVAFMPNMGLKIVKTYGSRSMGMIVSEGFPHRAALAAARLDEILKLRAEGAVQATQPDISVGSPHGQTPEDRACPHQG